MDRRRFLRMGAALAAAAPLSWIALALPRRVHARAAKSDEGRLLSESEFAYISPLLAGGRESSCHAELWYAWLDDSVVVNVSAKGWKARALDRGHARARVWVGNHGRWRGWFGKNESFREGHHFDARASIVRDEALLERLLATYEHKYPAEIATWRDRMRSGYRDGSRVLIRYLPERA